MTPVFSLLYLCLLSLASFVTVNSLPIPPIRQDAPKIVAAHFMVGNAYAYTIDMWKEDIELALDANIDAFALNLGSESWQEDRIADAYAAALQVSNEDGGDFKLFISFDMAVSPGTTASEADRLRSLITKYHDHPNQLKYNDKSFVSTFSGGDSTFGSGSANAGWQDQIKGPLEAAGVPVYLVASFFKSPQEIGAFTSLDGYFDWNSGWPLTAQATNTTCLDNLDACDSTEMGSWNPDAAFVDYFRSQGIDKTYMAAISPSFFTHYGPDSFNKNWIYSSDDNLYATRWETLISHREDVDFVEIITWNDYGESSYIGKIKGDQPNSQAWVDGFEHSALLDVTRYYAKAFKDGVAPEITSDQIFLTGRPHSKDATATSDAVGKPDNWQLTKDRVWGLFFLTAPATITIETSNGTNKKTIDMTSGVSKLNLDMVVGEGVKATIARGGKTVVINDPDRTFVDNPETYNFNHWISGARSS